ncbi:MAG: MoaD family protein [Candidatus Bathyarchaeota archaeon]|nr:MoaD family protein [Candidatus Bathyarchaeota archaeon]
MNIQVLFFTTLREIVNKKEDTLQFTGDTVTVANVLGVLSEKYGANFRDYVFDKTGKPRRFLQFLINGNNTATKDGLETLLHDCDVLAILPPVGGG